MKTLTEFTGIHIKNAAKLKNDLAASGKTPEELGPAMGETLKLEGDRLSFLMNAIETVGPKLEDLKRVIVMTAAEGEKIPESARKLGEHYFAVEYYPSLRAPQPEGRGGRDDKRGGRGGKDGKRGGGRGGKPGERGAGGGRGGERSGERGGAGGGGRGPGPRGPGAAGGGDSRGPRPMTVTRAPGGAPVIKPVIRPVSQPAAPVAAPAAESAPAPSDSGSGESQS